MPIRQITFALSRVNDLNHKTTKTKTKQKTSCSNEGSISGQWNSLTKQNTNPHGINEQTSQFTSKGKFSAKTYKVSWTAPSQLSWAWLSFAWRCFCYCSGLFTFASWDVVAPFPDRHCLCTSPPTWEEFRYWFLFSLLFIHLWIYIPTEYES